ncbi:MAG: hypothetical protein MUE93_06145 [Ignavibacteriaceae bacterium]|nr:hypothetical protein [Ignavibacteriaceae bacterium]
MNVVIIGSGGREHALALNQALAFLVKTLTSIHLTKLKLLNSAKKRK